MAKKQYTSVLETTAKTFKAKEEPKQQKEEPTPVKEPVIEKPKAEPKQTEEEPKQQKPRKVEKVSTELPSVIKERIEAAKQDDIALLNRASWYVSYESIEAVEYLSRQLDCKKYILVRAILEAGIEALQPGLLEDPEIKKKASLAKEEVIEREKSKQRKKLEKLGNAI